MLKFNYYKQDYNGEIYYIVKDFEGDLEVILINEDEAMKLCGVLNSMDKLCKYQNKTIEKYDEKLSILKQTHINQTEELDYYKRENKVLLKLLTE